MKANKGKKIDDPFTRRSTKPRMVYKPEDESDAVTTVPVNDKVSPHPTGDSVSAANDRENGQDSKKKQSTEDLFNAHDFDITIDLEVPISSKQCFAILRNACAKIVNKK